VVRRRISLSRPGPIVAAFWVILVLHLGLLALSIPEYRVTIDSAYHVSMGRQYGEHGLVSWDSINFGPQGRPNLQGPFLHAAIGGLGRLLGGRGDDYVLANAILAVSQWIAAMGTAAYFAFRLNGSVAMLLGVALLSGAAFAGTSFAVGIPSGWLFIFSPWAIWLFLANRILLASVLAALAIYSHIGGYLTAPLGIVLAGLLSRKWRELFKCGILTAVLTLPYSMHVLRYAGWLSGVKSHSALLFDPMLDVLALVATASLCFSPQAHPFLFSWLMTPIAWLFQDPGRFILQWPLAGSVAAGDWLASRLSHLKEPVRTRCVIGIAAMATILPCGLPSLAGEVAWVAGYHYPRAVDWQTARALAAVIDHARLTKSLISDYSPLLCPAIAVYVANISCEKGQWVEVQPRPDPAALLPAARKTYIVPLAPRDPLLLLLVSLHWAEIHSNTTGRRTLENSVVRLLSQPTVGEAASIASRTIVAEAGWLGHNAVNNSISFANLLSGWSHATREQFRSRLAEQRVRAGRIELACLIYAWALEPTNPEQAFELRRAAFDLGVIASYLGDDYALDFLGDGQLTRMRDRFLELASSSDRSALYPSPKAAFISALRSLTYAALKHGSGSSSGRPPGNWFAWLS